jgi:hypothetical protein
VRKSHLISGKIRSCGCLKAEVDEKRQARKRTRAFIKSCIVL